MKFTVLTLFPQLIEGFLSAGLLRQAVDRAEIEINTVNPRIYTTDVHHTVDDRAFGGSDGMVMKVEPLQAAIEACRRKEPCHVVVLSPQGRRWTQSLAREFALKQERIVLVCGRYAGIDNRFTVLADDEISIGDYILNGGETAACAIIESTSRLKPGVLGNRVSAEQDSFTKPLLECPQFTRPREVAGLKVPSPLLSGHHEKIRQFEQAVSIVRTKILRPDLLPETPENFERLLSAVAALPDDELKSLGMTREELAALRAE